MSPLKSENTGNFEIFAKIGNTDLSIGEVSEKSRTSEQKTGEMGDSRVTVVKIADTEDPKMTIAAKRVLKDIGFFKKIWIGIQTYFFYVKLAETDKESIYINVNSLAKRLHVPKSVIREAAKEGVDGVKKLLASYDPVEVHYKRIIDTYDQRYKKSHRVQGEGLSREAYLQAKTGLTPEQLRKVIIIAIKTPTPQQGKIVTLEGKQFIVLRSGHDLRITRYDNPKKLGAGAYGKALKVSDFVEGKGLVFKEAKQGNTEKATERARRDVLEEGKRLLEIHGNKRIWGILSKPHAIIQIAPEPPTQTGIYGYLGEKYHGDYFSVCNEEPPFNIPSTFENKLFEFQQLLFGLKHLHSLNMLHGDLKPENILVKKGGITHIADFGGARTLDEIEQESVNQSFDSVYTSYYCVYNEKLINQNLRKELYRISHEKETNPRYAEILETLKKLNEQRDVFAMGVILFQRLTKKDPYSFNRDRFNREFSDPTTGFHDEFLRAERIPPDIINLIKSMVSPNRNDRPSAERAFAILEAYIKKGYPDLATRIEAEQAALNPKVA